MLKTREVKWKQPGGLISQNLYKTYEIITGAEQRVSLERFLKKAQLIKLKYLKIMSI